MEQSTGLSYRDAVQEGVDAAAKAMERMPGRLALLFNLQAFIFCGYSL